MINPEEAISIRHELERAFKKVLPAKYICDPCFPEAEDLNSSIGRIKNYSKAVQPILLENEMLCLFKKEAFHFYLPMYAYIYLEGDDEVLGAIVFSLTNRNNISFFTETQLSALRRLFEYAIVLSPWMRGHIEIAQLRLDKEYSNRKNN